MARARYSIPADIEYDWQAGAVEYLSEIVLFDGEGVIQRGKVLIATDSTTQPERTHMIREELTQSLGLFKDSWEHSDSIFYEGWTTTDKYGPLDEATIRLLYQPQLVPGMDRNQVRSLYPPTD